MAYFTEIHKQTTICQVAAGALIGSGVALFIFLVRMMSSDFGLLSDMWLTMVLMAVSAVGVVVSAKVLESSHAKAELVRMTGGISRSAA
jgi:hypothetical protein